jgi:hypothetical protein
MNKRLFLAFLFLAPSIVLVAAPAIPTQPGDWVDRMIAGHSAALVAAAAAGASDRLPSGDWVDRMVAANASATQPGDWVDRMVADRSRDFTSPSLLQPEGVKTVFAPAGSTKNVAGVR